MVRVCRSLVEIANSCSSVARSTDGKYASMNAFIIMCSTRENSDPEDDEFRPLGPPTRCPDCRGMVFMPCRLCRELGIEMPDGNGHSVPQAPDVAQSEQVNRKSQWRRIHSTDCSAELFGGDPTRVPDDFPIPFEMDEHDEQFWDEVIALRVSRIPKRASLTVEEISDNYRKRRRGEVSES